jgi:AcrR family transcriptional regulator
LSARLLPLVRGSEPDDAERTPVLDAALDAFLDYGVRRTSMNEIAKRSRLSPATLYRRFAQKSDLVTAVALREVRKFLSEVDTQVDTAADTEEQVVQLFLACAGGIRSNLLLQRLMSTEPEIVLPRLTVEGSPVIELGRDYVADFIRRLQSEGKLPEYDALPVAELMARTVVSLALTPATVIPLAYDEPTRQFVLNHIAPFFGVPRA